MSVVRKSHSLPTIISFLFILYVTPFTYGQQVSTHTDYASLSTTIAEKTLQSNEQELDSLFALLAGVKFQVLKNQLYSDVRKKTFWLNIHNAFILRELRKNPTALKDRNKFFSSKTIPIAGVWFSLNDIEHGILRRSAFKVSVSDEIKQLRVLEIDYRVHFALYFGAKDCPAYTILEEHSLATQLKQLEHVYITQHTSLDSSKKEIVTTALFDWYKEDFGNKEGIRSILLKNGLQEATSWKINFQNFNWETRVQ